MLCSHVSFAHQLISSLCRLYQCCLSWQGRACWCPLLSWSEVGTQPCASLPYASSSSASSCMYGTGRLSKRICAFSDDSWKCGGPSYNLQVNSRKLIKYILSSFIKLTVYQHSMNNDRKLKNSILTAREDSWRLAIKTGWLVGLRRNHSVDYLDRKQNMITYVLTSSSVAAKRLAEFCC